MRTPPREVNGEIGATVWVNGSNTGSVVGVGGKVTINLDTLQADGRTSITLKDASNNQSGAATVSITKDATGPSMSAVFDYFPTAGAAGHRHHRKTERPVRLDHKSGSGPYSFAKSYSTNTTESAVFSDSPAQYHRQRQYRYRRSYDARCLRPPLLRILMLRSM